MISNENIFGKRINYLKTDMHPERVWLSGCISLRVVFFDFRCFLTDFFG